jgi:hypothetical protein
MVQELIEGIIELHARALDIRKELTDEQVFIANLECLWG